MIRPHFLNRGYARAVMVSHVTCKKELTEWSGFVMSVHMSVRCDEGSD